MEPPGTSWNAPEPFYRTWNLMEGSRKSQNIPEHSGIFYQLLSGSVTFHGVLSVILAQLLTVLRAVEHS